MAAREQPTQLYYPSWKVRLGVRFEEFADTTAVAAKAPSSKKLVTQLKGVKDSRGTLQVVQDPNAPAGTTRLLLQAPSAPAGATPQERDTSADGKSHLVGSIIAKELHWKANGIRKADELKVDLKFLDCPLDPRAIRSCFIEAYIGTVTADEYARGIAGEVRNRFSGGRDNGEPLHVIPDTYLDGEGRQRTNLRFQGWVDEWEVEWPEDDEPVVHLDCRDNSSLLFEQDAPPKLVVDPTLPIDRAVATYLSNFPQFAGLTVEYRPAGLDVPALGKALSKTAFQPKLGPTVTKSGGEQNRMSVMDYLTDVCGAIAHSIRMEGTTLVVQLVRTITSNSFPPRADDPFRGRQVGDATFQNRLFIYGRNVSEYKLARRFTKVQPKNVEVRSYSTLRKQVLVARFPTDLVQVNSGDGDSERKVLVWRVGGVEDGKTLRLIAQSIYETVGRNELSVHLATKNLASFGGSNEDPDLLDMLPGDTIEVLVDRTRPGETGTTVGAVEESMLVQASAQQFLEAAGYSGDFAAAYAKAYGDKGVQTAFRVRNFGVDCTIEDGVALAVEGVNYVEVRNDKALPGGEEPSASSTAGAKQTSQQQGR